jgi:hypothetical protein
MREDGVDAERGNVPLRFCVRGSLGDKVEAVFSSIEKCTIKKKKIRHIKLVIHVLSIKYK